MFYLKRILERESLLVKYESNISKGKGVFSGFDDEF